MKHVKRERRLTGTHITVIVVAIAVAVVGAPVSVMAATGSLVNITDPVTASYKARVDSGGRLQIGNGTKPLTMTGTVTGTVTAVPVVPAAAKHFQDSEIYSTLSKMAVVYPIPSGKGLAISDLVASTSGTGNGSNVNVQLVTMSLGGCTTTGPFSSEQVIESLYVPPSGTVSASLQTPMMIAPLVSTSTRCLLVYVGGFTSSDEMTTTMTGYWY